MTQRKTSKFHRSNKRKESQFFSAGCQTSPTYWNINTSHASSLTRQRNSTFTESHGSHHVWLHHSFCSLGATLLALCILMGSHWEQSPIGPELLPFFLTTSQLSKHWSLLLPLSPCEQELSVCYSLSPGASESSPADALGVAGTKCEWITQYIAGGQ